MLPFLIFWLPHRTTPFMRAAVASTGHLVTSVQLRNTKVKVLPHASSLPPPNLKKCIRTAYGSKKVDIGSVVPNFTTIFKYTHRYRHHGLIFSAAVEYRMLRHFVFNAMLAENSLAQLAEDGISVTGSRPVTDSKCG